MERASRRRPWGAARLASCGSRCAGAGGARRGERARRSTNIHSDRHTPCTVMGKFPYSSFPKCRPIRTIKSVPNKRVRAIDSAG